MQSAVKVLMFIFIGALVVLIITHAKGSSSVFTTIGGQVDNTANILAGTGAAGSGSGSTKLAGGSRYTGG
jgi:hypothetical protein